MKNLDLFLPESTYQALDVLAKTAGIPIPHFCSNVLTDYAAENLSQKPLNGNKGVPRQKEPSVDSAGLDSAVSHMDLISAIIAILKEKRGSEQKAVVEQLVFEKYREHFVKPYWQHHVGQGVPRWQKNTQFARNSACRLGLLKPPEDSGRGIWELTDKGWRFE